MNDNAILGNNTASKNSYNTTTEKKTKQKWIALSGQPNVGKSLIFNRLTGSMATVSNYPGTTIAVDKGNITIGSEKYDVWDLPGLYSLSPITEEERVAKKALLEEKPDYILHIVDGKNLTRMLPLALELSETGLKIILVVNMMDEAEREGITIDFKKLSEKTGIPVVPTVALSGKGINQILSFIVNYKRIHHRSAIETEDTIENDIQKLEKLLEKSYSVHPRCIAQLLLQEDEDTLKRVERQEPEKLCQIKKIIDKTKSRYKDSLVYIMRLKIHEVSESIVKETTSTEKKNRFRISEKLNQLMIRPVTGIPILLAVLYFVLYKFVGVFGAGTVVDLVEGKLFGEHINPAIESGVEKLIGSEIIRQLIIGEYGLVTLGLTYAIAIILPVVGAFFLAFSIIEDSGYLPRLSLLIDRLFKKIGLSGRAVIPMVLGLGCDTMATIVTRTQETKRERVIATLLLALAIPCSAQLGVIFALLAPSPMTLLVWGFVIVLNFLLVGFMASKIMPGQKPSFFMELPPLRIPKLSNVLSKTYTRIVWYLREVLPLFLIASVIIWILQITGVFSLILQGIEPVVNSIGLPNETSDVFLFGFFRRDYGAAGLFQMQDILNANQLAVSAVVLTLFVPCVAQLMVMFKERGAKTAIGIFLFVLILAFSMGWLLNFILNIFNITL